MGPERHDGALTEPATEIDRALQAALAVEPSPEFVARVRRRVANEHEPAASVWRWPWLVVAAGAAAAAILLAVVFSRPHAVPKPDATSSTSKADILLQSAPSPVVSGFGWTVDTPAPKGVGPRTVSQVRPTAPARSTEPEILIDPREAMALRRVVIAPITIEPLAPAAGAQGVRP